MGHLDNHKVCFITTTIIICVECHKVSFCNEWIISETSEWCLSVYLLIRWGVDRLALSTKTEYEEQFGIHFGKFIEVVFFYAAENSNNLLNNLLKICLRFVSKRYSDKPRAFFLFRDKMKVIQICATNFWPMFAFSQKNTSLRRSTVHVFLSLWWFVPIKRSFLETPKTRWSVISNFKMWKWITCENQSWVQIIRNCCIR